MPRRHTSVLILSLLLIPAFPALAGPQPPPTNILYGFISSNRTLTFAAPGPVYYVVGDVVVNPGVTLTIEPGVTLAFEALADTLGGGDYPTRSEIDVKGALMADGSSGDSIRFVSTGTGVADWGQIKVEAGGSATIKKAVIEGADLGLHLFGVTLASEFAARRVTSGAWIEPGASGHVRECVLTGAGGGYGLRVMGTMTVAAADSTDPRPIVVSRFTYGAKLESGVFQISHVAAHDNVYGIWANDFCTISYCTAVRNSAYGIYAAFGGRIYSSIATHSPGTGIRTDSNAYANYVDSWSNGQNYSTFGLGSQAASFNPFYVDYASNDLRLANGSVFKTYGPWGAEIGAYGPGPGTPVKVEAATWGKLRARWR